MSFHGGVPLNALIFWGAQDISPSVGTRILPPGYATTVLNNNTPKGFRSPRAGVLRNFTVRHNLANGNGQTVVYTIRVNGVDTAMSVTLASGATGSGIYTDQVSVALGDLVELKRVIVTAIGNGELECICAAEFMGAPMGTGAATM